MAFHFGGLKSRIAIAAVTASLSAALAPAAVAFAADLPPVDNTPSSGQEAVISVDGSAAIDEAPSSLRGEDSAEAEDSVRPSNVTSATEEDTPVAKGTQNPITETHDREPESTEVTEDFNVQNVQKDSASQIDDDARDTTAAEAKDAAVQVGSDQPLPSATKTATASETVASATDGEEPKQETPAAPAAPAERTLEQIASDNKGGEIIAPGIYVVRNRGKVLDVSGGSGSDGANVQLWDQNDTAAQSWQVSVDANGYLTLINLKSGKALDVANGSTASGTNVWQYGPNGTKAQKWAAERVNGGILLRSALQRDLALDVCNGSTQRGANVWTYTVNGTAAQIWEFVKTALSDYAAANKGGALLSAGSYVLQNADAFTVLDVASGSHADGANVQVWEANGTNAQVWNASVDDYGFVTLRNAGSGKVLDVSGGGAQRSQNVDQYSLNGTASQRWIVQRSNDGSLVLHSSLDYGLVLDVSGGSTADGANVALYDANGTKAQRWNFWASRPHVIASGRSAADGVYEIVSSVTGRVLDVASGSLDNSATVQTWQANSTGAQAWRLLLADDGFYYIRNAQSGRCLDVRDCIVIPGAPVQQWGLDGQKWNVVAVDGSGSYRIISATNGLALRASRNGSELVTTKIDDSDAYQLFRLKVAPQPLVADGWKTVATFSRDRVLDVVNGSEVSGASVQTYASNGTRAQKWWIRRYSDGSYSLQASNSGLYLSTGDEAHMAANAGSMTRWNVEYANRGGYALRNASTGKLLSVDGASNWLFTATTSGVQAGFYEIASVINQGMRLDVESGSKDSGANVQLYASNGTLAQRYWIRSAGNDTFTITNCNSDLNLDVTSAGTSNGTNIWQYARNNSAAQTFSFTMGESGLEIRSTLGNVVLDVKNGSASNGANVQIWQPNGTSAQAWILKTAVEPSKMGWQNPSWMYQVSQFSVPPVRGAEGIFGYMSPSTIGIEATRNDVVNAFVRRAYDYLGTPYRWDYACAPGVGVDCVGLVIQCCYSVGMDLGSGTGAYDFNPYAHYATGSSGWHSHDANNFWDGGKGIRLGLGSRQVGDLISWNGHIAIYIGNDRIIEAPGRNQVVRISNLWAYGTPRGVIRIFA